MKAMAITQLRIDITRLPLRQEYRQIVKVIKETGISTSLKKIFYDKI